MKFNDAPTDPHDIQEEVEKWVSSAKNEIRNQSFRKGLVYNYDFIEDRPIKNAYTRLLWDLTPIISPKSIPIRCSSASQAMSSLSTAIAMDYELMDYDLPDIRTNSIEIAPIIQQAARNSHQFCLRGKRGSIPPDYYIFKANSRSKSY